MGRSKDLSGAADIVAVLEREVARLHAHLRELAEAHHD
jgi:hypothetical protein